MKTIRDAVHGDMEFTDDELAFIDTPTFQRLRGIKQVGTSSLVYPSAVHTRFEHSLGTAWLTKRMLDGIASRGQAIRAADRDTAVLAALLHDVTHIPFGHTMEDERRLLQRHDQDAERLRYFLERSPLGHTLNQHPLGPRVRSVLCGEPATPPWIRQIVTGTICADLLDYLKRDAFFCGLRLQYDERLLSYFRLVDDQLVVRLHKDGAFRHDVLTEMIHLLQLRYTLTERVYYHHAKVASGAMISRAVELAMLSGQMAAKDLYEFRDDALLDQITRLDSGPECLGDLVDDLLSRRLYRTVYQLAAESPGRDGLATFDQDSLARAYHEDVLQRRATERSLAAALGVPESHVILYCPSGRMQRKEADVLVEISPGRVDALSSLSHPDVEALTAKHRGLWRIAVLVSRRDVHAFSPAARWCEETFGHANHLANNPLC